MKTIFLILTTALAIGARAQSSGVYLSASDFASGKLTYEINCATEKHKIKLNEFLNKDYITVVHNKVPNKLIKKDIYGYKDCDGAIYRFISNNHFTVLNPSESILIFKHTTSASKNQKAVTLYYFGFAGSEATSELTLSNLKKADPENHKFHDALDAEFKSDSDLALYDSFHKVYKISRLYSNSLSK